MKLRSLLLVCAVNFFTIQLATAEVFVEDFANPLGGWTSDWLYQNTNVENWYTATGNCDPNFRGNNPEGIWLSDDRGCGTMNVASPVQINILNGFGDAATHFSIDVCNYGTLTLEVYDKDGVLDSTLTMETPPSGNCGLPTDYYLREFTLTNGISRFDFAGGLIENGPDWVAIDNVMLDTTPVEDSVPTAVFTVTKDFTDDNPMPVEVTMRCNGGLPLTQSFVISDLGGNSQPVQQVNDGEGPGDPPSNFDSVSFVLTNFQAGITDCAIVENTILDGYSVSYDDGTPSDMDCSYDDITGGDYTCAITNSLNSKEAHVIKDWILDGKGGDSIDPTYRLVVFCNGEILGGTPEGQSGVWYLELYDGDSLGTTDQDFQPDVYPNWDGGTECWVKETVYDNSVEPSNGCGTEAAPGLLVEIDGPEPSCTITNTVFFEGIPTMNQYGLAIMALLMLGVGFVGFRRFM